MKHRCSFFYLFMLCGGMTVHLQASPYQGEPVCKMAIGNEQQPKLEDLRTLRNKYPLPIPKATQAEILSAQAAVDSYQLQRIDEKTVTDVTGLSHDAMTYQQNREVAKNVRALAAVAYNGGQAEKKTFELWKQRFENFVGCVDTLCVPLCRKHDKWLDNCETCRLLNVSARTMQTYRDTGKLPYSQINNKIYYKVSDVETFMQNHVKNNSKK